MPEQRGTENGKPWIRWGNVGTKRYYIAGNARSLAQAKKLVDEDRRRIESFSK